MHYQVTYSIIHIYHFGSFTTYSKRCVKVWNAQAMGCIRFIPYSFTVYIISCQGGDVNRTLDDIFAYNMVIIYDILSYHYGKDYIDNRYFMLYDCTEGAGVYDASRHDTESEIKRSTYASQ